MVGTLEQAIAQISRLPDADQERIGRKLLAHVVKLKAIRTEIDRGIRLLDDSKGRALDMEDFLRDKNSRYGRA